MPTVPYSQKVRESALPSSRVSTNAPIEAFGGGTGKVIQAGGQAAQAVANFAADQQRIAENLRMREVGNEATALSNALKKKYTTTEHGKNALENYGKYQDEYKKGLEKISKGLSSAGQRDGFKMMAQELDADFFGTLDKHFGVEKIKHAESVYKSTLDLLDESISQNPLDSGLHIKNKQKAIVQQQDVMGWSDDETKLTLYNETSKGHRIAITNMLKAGNDGAIAAKKYFDAVKDLQMTDKDKNAIRDDLKTSLNVGLADELAQKAVTLGTVGKAVKYLDEVKNLEPEVKQKAITMVKERFAIQEQSKKQVEDNAFDSLSDKMASGMTYHELEAKYPGTFRAMNDTQRAALRKTYEENLKPVDRANDDIKYIEFSEMSDQRIASLSSAEFKSAYWVDFDNEHRKKAETRWANARRSGEEHNKISPLSAYKEVIELEYKAATNKSLNVADQKKQTKDQAKVVLNIMSTIEDFEVNGLKGTRRATQEEIRKLVRDSLTKRAYVEKGYIWDSTIEKESGALTPEQREQSFVPMNKIPAQAQASNNALLDRYGFTGDKLERERMIEKLYAAYLDKDEARVKRILGLISGRAQKRQPDKSIPEKPSTKYSSPVDFRKVK